jgi:hypothetical protein
MRDSIACLILPNRATRFGSAEKPDMQCLDGDASHAFSEVWSLLVHIIAALSIMAS